MRTDTNGFSGVAGCLKLYYSLPHACPVPVKSWSCTTSAPVPGSPSARELDLGHVTLRAVPRPVTLIVADAGPGRPNFVALVPVCTTWEGKSDRREKGISLISIVREGKEPQGHARKRLMQAA